MRLAATVQFIVAATAVAAAAVLAATWLVPTPAFDAVRAAHRPSEAYLYDRHGELLQSLRLESRERRLPWVPLDAVSPALVQALLAVEDRRFETHPGVDPRALAASLRDWLLGRGMRGASTLTMQLAALLDPTLNERGERRSLQLKLRQALAALALERRWTKHEILEAYVNLASWRGELVGIAAATAGLEVGSPGTELEFAL